MKESLISALIRCRWQRALCRMRQRRIVSAVPGTAIIKSRSSNSLEMLGERFEELFRLRNMQTQKMSSRLGKCE